ncbi:MAG: response regulator [Pseudomonadota bacterium]|nr:response regulator [Pseudomonadota bacterium]
MEPLQDRILIVDDDPLNVRVLVEFLRGEYGLTIARDGQQTLDRLQAGPLPDLILLDVMMPGMDGYEVCRRIKADPATRAVPVIFVTALNQPFDESAAFDAGAVDFLTKPIAPAVLQARVRTHLRLRRSERLLTRQNAQLDEQVRARTRELSLTKAVMIRALAILSSLRDDDGAAHQRRTQNYVLALGRAAQRHPAFAGAISDRMLDALYRLTPLHDIGKIGVQAHIPGSTRSPAEDEAEMRRHPVIGRNALTAALESEGAGDIEFLHIAADLIGSHHERWDGQGYPDGLAGDAIPLPGRLMAIADAYDIAVSAPPWQPGVRHEDAVQLIQQGSGSRFDPRLVEAFLAAAEEFRQSAGHYPDDPA